MSATPSDTPAEPSLARFDHPITVTPDDIDMLGHVNNTVYLRWVQEAAVAHWTAFASPEEQARLAWVVTRHEIDYLHSVQRHDAVIARTWVGSTVKHLFERHTEIIRTADGKLLAQARTLWCPIDIATRRPTRAGNDIFRRFSHSS
jgi:acyl-CoA thioester hydrolase